MYILIFYLYITNKEKKLECILNNVLIDFYLHTSDLYKTNIEWTLGAVGGRNSEPAIS